MRTMHDLQKKGRLPGANITSIDIGGGSSPLQYFMAERGHVMNIDINFMSSWFSTDANGIYVRGFPDRILSTLHIFTGNPDRILYIYRYICTGNPRSHPPNSPPHYKGGRGLARRAVKDSHSVGRRHLWCMLLHSHVGPLPNAPGWFVRGHGTDCQV